TPTASKIINLIQSDTGRPVGHIVSNLVNYDRLVEDIKAVLDTLVPKGVEVQTTDSKWYMMRILPYRTLDNVIEGAVITFAEITERKQVEEVLQKVLDDIKTLHGIIPICMNCKNIRDDRGCWNQLEIYVRDHTEAQFSHGLCPECTNKLYPDLDLDEGEPPENKGGA
ncbi:MAG: PAS domain-containing protein, partial [Proteobacteria bacterium]|nr:PAS domain-containing protein [Pseudomonadota bacterium]